MSVVFAGLPVSGLEEALVFYERLFDREPDMRPNEIEACWQVGSEGWLYIIEEPERAGEGLVTLLIGDRFDHMVSVTGPGELVEKGGMRTMWVADPDGNRIQLGDGG